METADGDVREIRGIEIYVNPELKCDCICNIGCGIALKHDSVIKSRDPGKKW